MRCQFCGKENPEDYLFCTYCGTVLARPADLSRREVKESRQRLADIVAERRRTDRIISPLWIVLAVVISVVASLVGIVITFSVLWDEMAADPDYDPYAEGYPEEALSGMLVIASGGYIFYFIFGVLTYFIVDRLNKHFDREKILRQEIVSLIRTFMKSHELESRALNEMYAIERSEQYAEPRRQPAFWALIIMLPIVVSVLSLISIFSGRASAGLVGLGIIFGLTIFVAELYLLYALGKVIFEHDTRWNDFTYSAQMAMSKVGLPAAISYSLPRLHRRSALLYVVLTIFTGGLFLYYWWYTVIKDPNDHFRRQWEFEDSLMSSLGAG